MAPTYQPNLTRLQSPLMCFSFPGVRAGNNVLLMVCCAHGGRGQVAHLCAAFAPTVWTLSVSAERRPDLTLLVACAPDLATFGLPATAEEMTPPAGPSARRAGTGRPWRPTRAHASFIFRAAEGEPGFFVVVAESKRC